jgi:hypothetical protein
MDPVATIRQHICEHDVVRFRRQTGRWPAGQEGTVVAVEGCSKLVEISDQQGALLDLVTTSDANLELIWSPGTAPHAARKSG